jgi:hypothetical protein
MRTVSGTASASAAFFGAICKRLLLGLLNPFAPFASLHAKTKLRNCG